MDQVSYDALETLPWLDKGGREKPGEEKLLQEGQQEAPPVAEQVKLLRKEEKVTAERFPMKQIVNENLT